MQPDPSRDTSAFAQQTEYWQVPPLAQDLRDALQQQYPRQAPGTMTAKVLARLAAHRWQAERRHRAALLLLAVSFTCALLSWLILVAWEAGLGASLLALLGAMLVAVADIWTRAQALRSRRSAGTPSAFGE